MNPIFQIILNFSKNNQEKSPHISLTKATGLPSSRSHDDNIATSLTRHGKIYSSLRRSVLEASTEQEHDSSATEDYDEVKSMVSSSSTKADYGQIQLTLQYDVNKSKLLIKIVQAKDLFNQPTDVNKETLDTFVRVMLLPDRRIWIP